MTLPSVASSGSGDWWRGVIAVNREDRMLHCWNTGLQRHLNLDRQRDRAPILSEGDCRARYVSETNPDPPERMRVAYLLADNHSKASREAMFHQDRGYDH